MNEPLLPAWLRVGRDAVNVTVIAKPGAPRTGVIRVDPRGIVIAIAAAPERGRANDELVAFLSNALHVRRAAVSIVRGVSARSKVVRIETATPEVTARALLDLGSRQTAAPVARRIKIETH